MKQAIAHDVRVTEAVPGIHRVELDDKMVGYVQKEGTVYVSLSGSVYNTSCEVAQTLSLDTAVTAVVEAA